MADLIICLTPLQALMAQRLMAQCAEPFDLLMLCYEDADNAKFRHYFQVASAPLGGYLKIRLPTH